MDDTIKEQVVFACRHLLSEQDSNPYSTTYGCFDRRYWGWKIVDYPEATYQRNVYPLAWLLKHLEDSPFDHSLLEERVRAGLLYSAHVQHPNGSFDQSFPFEQSFGATAFLIHPLLVSYQIIQDKLSVQDKYVIENMLKQGANFLSSGQETHAHIANHLAGGALSLLVSYEFFKAPHYKKQANTILQNILDHQSREGWFLEYEGADPGYQTLCMYYLAQIYKIQPEQRLHNALENSLEFLAWYVTDSIGGLYGSRRTAVYYPGGIAQLSKDFDLANRITHSMLNSIKNRTTITLLDIDIGNIAPLLSSYVLTLEVDIPDRSHRPLPIEINGFKDFPEAGLFIRSTKKFFFIFGASNGGTLSVFDKSKQRLCYDDGGYMGETSSGKKITTQITNHSNQVSLETSCISVKTPFYFFEFAPPTSIQMIALRILNLTVMRNIHIGNWVKQLLTRLLIVGKKTYPLLLTRTIEYSDTSLRINDTFSGKTNLEKLEHGRQFSGIHMASANYFDGHTSTPSITVRDFQNPHITILFTNSIDESS